MLLSVGFLGTSASRPTIERGLSSLAIVREGETMLVDCGEGTQRQMMRYGVSFALGDIFFTHFHADHFLGLPGLLRTLSLQDRTEVLRLWGPRGVLQMVKWAEGAGVERLTFPIEVHEVAPGEAIRRDGYSMIPFPVDHRAPVAVGYALIEEERRGIFDPVRARELGVPEGPLWGRIHRGEAVTLGDGRTIDPSELVGQPRPGRRVVVTGDTRPCQSTIEASRGADLLVHEATFGDEEAARAVETGHTTAREAAEVAAAAGVKRLVLTHFSARYSRDPSELVRQARERFAATSCARDGHEEVVPFADTPAGQS
ncbi:MAG: ribonuclease Z [Gemmatimonadaceae bacterium]|nr:ribonuclease Z [Gemmatimonadaceae bacterium]